MIGSRFAHYRIVDRLGAGGMGEVYRARDENLPRDVAIKVLPAGALSDEPVRRRFRKEAEALSQLNHPHIAMIYDFDTQDGVDFLVMEFVEGTTLAERLAEGQLPVDEVLRLGGEIASALEEAHGRGIVHRDLKPRNIGLTPRGQVKVLDFGLAKVLRPATDMSMTESMTRAAEVAGTLSYMAPEQLRGTAADQRSDLYSLGVVLYEMSTGRQPFRQDLASALIDDILHATPEPPRRVNPSLSRGFDSIIIRCLEKEPGRRYSSARDVLCDLARVNLRGFRLRLMGRTFFRRRVLILASGLLGFLATAWALNLGNFRDKPSGQARVPVIEAVVALPSKVIAAEEDAFLAEAIPNTISTYLSQVEGLETKLPPSSLEVERVGGDFGKIAKAYGVGALVVSTVTARSEELSLNVQLVEAGTRRLLWSRDYAGTRQAFLELNRAAAEDLRAAIRPTAAPVPAATGLSGSEMRFQRGLYYSNRYGILFDPADFERAFSAFQHVLELDPRRADVAAEIGMLYDLKNEAGVLPAEAVSQIETWGRRALQLEPRNARAMVVLSYYELRINGNAEAALTAALRAVSLAPRDAVCQTTLAVSLAWSGSIRLALEASLLASRLDPLEFYPTLNAALYKSLLGKPSEAQLLIDQVLELEPEMPFALMERGNALLLLGRTQEAAEILARLEPIAAAGRLKSEELRSFRDLVAQEKGESIDVELHPPLDLLASLILARRGDKEAALEAVGACHVKIYDWLVLCPFLQPLRGDARFDTMLTMARARFDRTLDLLLEARERGEFPAYLERPLAELMADLGMSHDR